MTDALTHEPGSRHNADTGVTPKYNKITRVPDRFTLACRYYLIKHIRNILLAAGLLGVAELRGVLTRQQTLVSDQCHALVGHLVPFKVNLVVRTTCKRKTF